MCVQSCVGGEPRSLPQGRRAGKCQCGETSRKGPVRKKGHTQYHGQQADNTHTHTARCTTQPHAVSHTFIHSYIHTFIHSYIHTERNKRSAAQQNTARDARVHLIHKSAPQPRGSLFGELLQGVLRPHIPLLVPADTMPSLYALERRLLRPSAGLVASHALGGGARGGTQGSWVLRLYPRYTSEEMGDTERGPRSYFAKFDFLSVFIPVYLTGYAINIRWSRFGGRQQRLRARVTSPVWWTLLLCLRLRLPLCLFLSLLLTAIPRPMHQIPQHCQKMPHFPLQKWEKRPLTAVRRSNAPDLSGIPAQADSASEGNP